MAMLQRADVRAPVLPKETVHVDALGGEVIVRSQLLSERLELMALNTQLAVPKDGETAAQARARAGAQLVSYTLARCVVLADGQPMYSQEEWDRIGAQYPNDVLALFNKSRALSGHDSELNAKN